MTKVRVMIVEDSQVIRELLTHIIAGDSRLELVGAVESGEDALPMVDATSPDVISIDIRLPGMNGFELTRQIMRNRPTPIVVVSASVESEDLQITMNALSAGALTVLEKPTGVTARDYETLAQRLCTQLVVMSQVKVVRRHAARAAFPREPQTRRIPADFRMLGIVSSTGGPNALVQLLNGLGASFPLPVLLVQHITSSFLEGFTGWLQTVTPFQIQIVKERVLAVPGKIYVAAPEHHLQLEKEYVRTRAGDPVRAQRPSGTVLFESMANVLGTRGLGVLLTGMGDDGAHGLLRLRQCGGHTIAEDESTAVVYGMPAEAVRLGAVAESLPLTAIAPRILQLTGPRREVA